MAIIYGLHFGNHSYSVSQIVDGKITYAVEDEKIRGQKQHTLWEVSPLPSLQAIEKASGIKIKDADYIAIGDRKLVANYHTTNFNGWGEERGKIARDNYLGVIDLLKGTKAKWFFSEHHQQHAATAYYFSGFEKAIIVTSDGGSADNEVGTIWLADNGKMTKVHSINDRVNGGSLSNLFFLSCEYFGFIPLKDEGKIMGMAGHGKYDEYIYNHFKNMVHYQGNLNWSPPFSAQRTTWLLDKLTDEGYFSTQEKKQDVAYNLQLYVENEFLKYIEDVAKKYPDYKNLGCAGGIFANVKMNQKINESGYFDQMFVAPCMGDEGLSLGAAILASVEAGDWKPYKLENAFLGLESTEEEIHAEAAKYPDLKRLDFDYKTIANLLHEGNIVALFNGKFEFGPRALGARSIMVRATDKGTHELLNERLNRHEIMPFAPFVLGEQAHNVFNIPSSEHSAEFMTLCYTAKDEWVDKIPAVIHRVDNTGRPQIVYKHNNPVFWNILNEYYKTSGIPVMLNTSFNGHGEPIIAFPDRAFSHLNKGTIDYLVIGNNIYYK